MLGIIAIGGKQYNFAKNEAFETEKIEGEIDSIVQLKDILFLQDKDFIFDPLKLSNYAINCRIIKQYRDDKVLIYKKKRRKGYTRKRGHRQYKTILMVENLVNLD